MDTGRCDVVRRVLQVSLSADPLNPVDGGAAGGLQVLVREMVRGLGAQGVGADVLACHQGRMTPGRSSLGHLSRVIRIGQGKGRPRDDADWVVRRDALVAEALSWIEREGAEYDLVHSHFWVSGLVAGPIAAKLAVPWVHSPYKTAQFARRGEEPVSARRVEIERSLAAEASSVVVAYLGEGDGVHRDAPRTPLFVIPPAVDPTAFFVRDPGPVLKGLGLRRRPLLYVGRLAAGRGLEALIAEMARRELPSDLVLVVIGGSRGDVRGGEPADPELQRWAHQLKEHVRFLGPMPHAAVAQYMASAAVVIAPNQGPTLGMAAIETLAVGRPLVGSRVSGIQDWITPGVDGFIFPRDDVAGMLEQAISLWDDADRARRMGQRGFEKIHHHHTVTHMTEQLRRVYEEVIRDARGQTGVGNGY